MTLSGQTNSSTLNILLGVRRSDLPLPPPPPTFSGRLPLFLCPLPLGAPAYFAPTGCGSVGALLLRWGSTSRGPPYLQVLFLCGPTWVMLSLPSFVLSLTFRSRSGFAFLGSWLCQSGASACVFFGASLSLLRSSPCLVGPRCFRSWFLVVVGSPPCQMLLPFPPRLFRVAPWPSLYAGPSLWVSGCICDGLVALLYCWECGCALSSLLHFVSWQQRLLALCGVCITLSTMLHVLLGCSV